MRVVQRIRGWRVAEERSMFWMVRWLHVHAYREAEAKKGRNKRILRLRDDEKEEEIEVFIASLGDVIEDSSSASLSINLHTHPARVVRLGLADEYYVESKLMLLFAPEEADCNSDYLRGV